MSAIVAARARFTGVQATPITPFREDGSLDADGVEENARRLIADGAAGLVACGSIGELPTLTQDEWRIVVAANIAASVGDTPVFATVGHPDTRIVWQMIEQAAALGAVGVVVVPPYYYGLREDEVVAFYRNVDAVGVPFVVYSHPGSGRPDVGVAAIEEIATFANFAGLKEASPDGREFLAKQRALFGHAPILAAAESYLFFMLVAGADGCMTAVSAFSPSFLVRLRDAVVSGDLATARVLNERLLAFREIVHRESVAGRPGYITVSKAAAVLCGLRAGPPRPPLTALSPEGYANLESVLRDELAVLDGRMLIRSPSTAQPHAAFR